MGQLDLVACARRQFTIFLRESFFQWSKHQRERRAKFVAHVGKERGLHAIEFGQGFGATTFFFVSARVGNGRRDLAGCEFNETLVRVVEAASWTQARNEETGELVRDI